MQHPRKKEILMVGEINANYLLRQRDDGASRELKNVLKSMTLSQLVRDPTRITKTSKSLIDVILSTHPQNIPFTVVVPVGLSDHFMVGCVRKMNSLKFQARAVTGRTYSKYHKDSFVNDLKNVSWEAVFDSTNVNDAWTINMHQ